MHYSLTEFLHTPCVEPRLDAVETELECAEERILECLFVDVIRAPETFRPTVINLLKPLGDFHWLMMKLSG
jgi:hypothetical protein